MQLCVARRVIGKSLSVLGRKVTTTAEEGIVELQNNLFTANTIDQVNCDPLRMSVNKQISMIGGILNSKREADGNSPLDVVNFFCIHIA